jgi:dephospho-CoA kinase
MKLFIGLVGEKGGGKDTFAETFKSLVNDFSIGRCRSSDILAQTLEKWSLPKTRHNLQHLAIVMDQGFGVGTLTAALKANILKMQEDIIIFDAVRWMSDVELARSFPLNFLVYITADSKIRYERTKARKEKVGEATTTYEQFLEDEKVSTETDIPVIGRAADATIINGNDLERFKAAVLEFYQQKVLPTLQRL